MAKVKIAWFLIFLGPPFGYLISLFSEAAQNYDGTCQNILEQGAECTFFEYIFDYFTHPFIFPAILLLFLGWIAFVGVIYFVIKIFNKHRLKSNSQT